MMIIETESLEHFDDFKDFCALKIKCLIKAYGFGYDFLKCYMQFDFFNKPTALIVKFYGSLTVSALDNCNTDEISQFVNMLPINEILCGRSLCNSVPHLSSAECFAMTVETDSYSSASTEFINHCGYDELKRIYEMFSSDDEDISVGEFQHWYTDVNHRLRHGAAYVASEPYGGCVCITNGEEIIINGIIVQKNHRRMGYGRKIIDCIYGLPENRIWALCTEKNIPFYIKCGFRKSGSYYILKV